MKPFLPLIINPVAGSFHRKRFQKACDILREKFILKEFYTQKRGDAQEIAREVSKESPAAIAVVGGDGTFNEVINATAYSGIPLSFIPAGTSNVLAKEHLIPEEMVEAAKRILSGRETELHLGYINGRYFALMAGAGFDGATVYNLNKPLKILLGKGAYVLSGLQTFCRYRPERLKIDVDGREYEATDVIVCNARRYGGNFTICPDADMRRPLLDLFILDGKGRMDLFRVFLGIIRGKRLEFSNTSYLEARRVYIDGDAHVQVDGDYFGRTPVEITIRERAIKLII